MMSCLNFKAKGPVCSCGKELSSLIGPFSKLNPTEKRLYTLALLCKKSTKLCLSSGSGGGRHHMTKELKYSLVAPNEDSSTSKIESEDSWYSSYHEASSEYESAVDKGHAGGEANVCRICRLLVENENIWSLVTPNNPLPPVVFQQSYKQWKAAMDIGFTIRKIRKRRRIYLQPFEDLPSSFRDFRYSWKDSDAEPRFGFVEFLCEFAQLFFTGLSVSVLQSICMKGWRVSSRSRDITGQRQYLVTDINKNLKSLLPRNGYCIIGITGVVLYPSEDLNFVLGQSSMNLRSGTISFGQYDAGGTMWDNADMPHGSKSNINGELVWKMLKVMSHETCHMFGLTHCVFFSCLMNESSSVTEALNQPIFLCPVCLRKLQKACQFDLLQRYSGLYRFLRMVQREYPSSYVNSAVDWLKKCLSQLQ